MREKGAAQPKKPCFLFFYWNDNDFLSPSRSCWFLICATLKYGIQRTILFSVGSNCLIYALGLILHCLALCGKMHSKCARNAADPIMCCTALPLFTCAKVTGVQPSQRQDDLSFLLGSSEMSQCHQNDSFSIFCRECAWDGGGWGFFCPGHT